MPSRNFSFQSSDSGFIVTPRGGVNSSTDIFDKAFNEVGLEEWDEWMRWEGAATELLPASIERRGSTASTISSPEEPWFGSSEASAIDPMSISYSNANNLSFQDAPFELDETATSVSSVSNYGGSAPYTQQELRGSYRGLSSLTAAEEQSLQDIAMPHQAPSDIKIASAPVSPMESQVSEPASISPEPEVRTRKNNKRKSAALVELPSTLCQSRKRGHNAIEKRYRTNLNAKIERLREGVPSLCGGEKLAGGEEPDGEGADSNKVAQQKYGKAAILTRALEYIKHLESTAQRLGSELDGLKSRVGAFETLAMNGSMILSGNGLDTVSRPALKKSETLESIQSGT